GGLQRLVFEVSDVGNAAQVAVILQARDDLRKRQLALTFNDVDIRADVVERRTKFVAAVVTVVIIDERSTDDDLDVAVVLSDELDHLDEGEINNVERSCDRD